MRRSSLPLPALRPALLALLAAACEGGEVRPADTSGAAAPAAASPAAAPATPTAASAGSVSLTLRGAGVDVTGEGPARRCGGPAYLPPAPTKGVYYEGTVEGHTIAMGDMEQRRPGAQELLRAGGSGWEGTVNAPGKSYAILRERPATIRVSDDFRTAEMEATVKPIGEPGEYALTVTFRCP